MSASLTQMLGSAADPPEIFYAGKAWKVGAPDQQAKQRLEKFVASASLEQVRQLRGVLDPAAYDEAFREATRSLPDYKTWGPGWQRAVNDPANAHLFLLSLLRGPQPWAAEDDARGMLRDARGEVQAALAQVVAGFFAFLLRDRIEREVPEDRRAEAEDLAAAQVGPVLDALLATFRPPPTPTPPTPSAP